MRRHLEKFADRIDSACRTHSIRSILGMTNNKRV